MIHRHGRDKQEPFVQVGASMLGEPVKLRHRQTPEGLEATGLHFRRASIELTDWTAAQFRATLVAFEFHKPGPRNRTEAK